MTRIEVGLHETNLLTRFPCSVCGGTTDKEMVLAEFVDDDGDRHQVCGSVLNLSADRATLGSCGLGTHTLRVRCEDAHGLRAGALIAVLGGLRAERRATVPTKQIEGTIELLDFAIERSGDAH